MRSKGLVLLAAAMLLSCACGCSTDAHELDERTYVYSIGVDKGVTDKLRFTFQYPTFSNKRGQSGGGEAANMESSDELSTVTIDSPTLYTGVVMFYSCYSRRLDFSHAQYLIIAEELAREGVEPFINGMTRSPDIRRTMYVIVCKSKASEFIEELRPYSGTSVSKAQELLMENADVSELYESMTYNEFADDMKCTKCQSTATLAALNDFSAFKETGGSQSGGFKSEGDYYPGELPRKSKSRCEFLGTAVFNGARMVGELNGNETRAMLMLNGKFKQSQIAVPDPTDPSLRIGALVLPKKKPDIKVSFDEGKPKVHAKVFLEGVLQNVQSDMDIETAYQAATEDAFRSFVKSQLDATIKKCRELNCDALDFGYRAAVHFWTLQDWEAYDWLSHFKDAEVTTEVEFIMRRTGTLISTEDEKRAEGN